MASFIVRFQDLFHECRLTRFSVSYHHIYDVPRRVSRPSGRCRPSLPRSRSRSLDHITDQREVNGQDIQVAKSSKWRSWVSRIQASCVIQLRSFPCPNNSFFWLLQLPSYLGRSYYLSAC